MWGPAHDRCAWAKGGATPSIRSALTGALARRPQRRPGVAPPFAQAGVQNEHGELHKALTSVAVMGHHASDCPAALGPVKARRFAPPARRAAGGLDRPSEQPGWALT